MAKSKVMRAVRFLRERLEEGGLRVSKIVLFGSQARGRAVADSDMDIVIVSEDFRNKDLFERIDLTKDAEVATVKRFMIPLDILTMTPEELASETSPLADIARNGKVMRGT